MMVLVLILHVTEISSRLFSVLLNASKGFSNLRHSTNIHVVADILYKYGSTPADMVSLIIEDPIFDPRNSKPGRAYTSNTSYITVPPINPTQFTVSTFLNILRCNHPLMRHLDKSTHILIYMCGHGADGVLKFHDRDFLHVSDIMQGLVYLSGRVCKVLVILDTCQAETLVYKDMVPSNVCVIYTSVKGEPSVSKNSNEDVGCAVIDTFPKMFYEMLCESESDSVGCDIKEFVSGFGFESVGSTVKKVGRDDYKVKDFIVQSNGEKERYL